MHQASTAVCSSEVVTKVVMLKASRLASSAQQYADAMAALLRRGVIALPCGEGADFAMALVPPLTATDAQLQFCVDALKAACDEQARS